MSYIRGKWYAYNASADGTPQSNVIVLHGMPSDCGCEQHGENPSIQLPETVFDALVLMRHAEMGEDEKLRAFAFVIDHARGNGGADSLLSRFGVRGYFDEERKWYDHFTRDPFVEIKALPNASRKHGRKRVNTPRSVAKKKVGRKK